MPTVGKCRISAYRNMIPEVSPWMETFKHCLLLLIASKTDHKSIELRFSILIFNLKVILLWIYLSIKKCFSGLNMTFFVLW